MSAALKFEIFHQGELLREIPYDGGVVWLGRGEDCAIRLDDRAISRKRAARTISNPRQATRARPEGSWVRT